MEPALQRAARGLITKFLQNSFDPLATSARKEQKQSITSTSN